MKTETLRQKYNRIATENIEIRKSPDDGNFNYVHIENVFEIIEDLIDEQTENWVSVSDRLPEVGERVMICFIGHITGTQHFKIDHLIQYHSTPPEWKLTSIEAKVTHWMPLPLAPLPLSKD